MYVYKVIKIYKLTISLKSINNKEDIISNYQKLRLICRGLNNNIILFYNMNYYYIWLNELINEKARSFNEYFYSDIGEYLNVDNEIEFNETVNKINSMLYKKIKDCNSKEEVKSWLNDVTSYIIKNLDIENIIDNYFAK